MESDFKGKKVGKEELLSKIKTEFEKEANQIVEKTDLEIRRMEKENEEKISVKRHEIFTDVHKNLEDIRRRDLIETDIRIRTLLLEVKQNLIDNVFREAQNKIKSADYQKLISDMFMNSVQNGEGEVIFSKEDSKLFNDDFIRGINSKIKALNKNSHYTISKKYGNFCAGFILRYSGIEINNTFETIFEHLRKDLEMEVGKILFP